jgi:transcriptional regulator with XRE-family HTH domain
MADFSSYLGSVESLMSGGLGPLRKMIRLLYLLKQGKTRAEIAGIFGVTRRTIYQWEHRAKVLMGAKTTMELICWACREGLFDRFEDRPLAGRQDEGGLGGRAGLA